MSAAHVPDPGPFQGAAPPSEIAALAGRLRAFAAERAWHPFHSPKNLAMAVSVEAAELLEHFQWLTEDQSRQLDEGQRQAVAAEMADVLLYLVQLSTAIGIDLVDAANRKIDVNAAKYPVERAYGRSDKADRLP